LLLKLIRNNKVSYDNPKDRYIIC